MPTAQIVMIRHFNVATSAKILNSNPFLIERIMDEIKNNDRIKLYTNSNGYNEDFFKKTFLDENIKFDMMLDDGPHSLESMTEFIKLYSQIMTEYGILMIEDIPSLEWIDEFKLVVPENLKNIYKRMI